MSEENVEIVRRGHEAWNSGNLEAALELIDPDVHSYVAHPLPDPREYQGHDGLLQMFANWTEGFDEFEQRPAEFIDVGEDQVLLRIDQRATGMESGVPVEGSYWFLHTVRNGKLTRIGVYNSKEQALEAADVRQ